MINKRFMYFISIIKCHHLESKNLRSKIVRISRYFDLISILELFVRLALLTDAEPSRGRGRAYQVNNHNG